MLAALAVAAGSSVLFAGSASAVDASTAPTPDRVAGENRYATAVAISQELTPDDSCPGGVVVVNGENYPDGLAASVFGQIVLLTKADSLPAETATELARLDEVCDGLDVLVVGGTSAVSNAVYGEIAQIIGGYLSMQRLAGENRYETAIDVAEFFFDSLLWGWTTLAGPSGTVILATGENFPDALAAGPMSAAYGMPILLNSGASVRADLGQFLVDNGVYNVIIVGGTSAVPESVEDELTGFYDMNVERVSGDDRAGTAVAIAEILCSDFLVDAGGIARTQAILTCPALTAVNGNSFADALAASTLALNTGAPILLVNEVSIPAATAEYHIENCASISFITAVGGTSVISDAVVEGAVGAATCATPAVTSVTLAISDETSRTITLTDDYECDDLGSETVKLTAVEAGVVANEYSINFVSSAVPADWGLEVDGFDLEYTDNFDSLDELTFVANWNAADGGRFFTASGGEADTTMYYEPDYIDAWDDYETCNDDDLAEATMTIVVNFSVPSVPFEEVIEEFDWYISSGSNPSTGDFLLTDEWCEDESWAEDLLSYTCVLEDETYLTDSYILEPRVGVDSFRIDSFEFFAAIGFEGNDGQLVTLSAP